MKLKIKEIVNISIEINELLEREKKGYEFLNNDSISEEKKEKWRPEYIQIVEALSMLYLKLYNCTGVDNDDTFQMSGIELPNLNK